MEEKRKRKILVIDDEEAVTELVKLKLERSGFEVYVANDGLDGMRALERVRPDLIILDILMPKVDGIEACNILNKDEVGKKTPIIVLSALDKDIDRLKAYKAGVVDYMTKPIKVGDLIEKIEKALEYK